MEIVKVIMGGIIIIMLWGIGHMLSDIWEMLSNYFGNDEDGE